MGDAGFSSLTVTINFSILKEKKLFYWLQIFATAAPESRFGMVWDQVCRKLKGASLQVHPIFLGKITVLVYVGLNVQFQDELQCPETTLFD